ncbi:exonuclease subunit SbcD [cf. Phormidesmis sp. LEGE 11477]|uniref:exonuclease subunit SbcD n=1 Tax=cf. Phormidesmis sp. LEGE 11477 TaxID=1828680 RepID=UPI001881F170|nr:exonuclease subunit SbcD [cf. Phormidesmis sp. LEGE 11477]MBE9061538.1 exonuclease subunit SbcD [cf. Phormidesmis sp. LEGE 11477]
MIKILHLSDIHMGSGFSHGRINPETGLNTRLEDFSRALCRCVDDAIAQEVDLVLFGGDAFPDATPPPYIQQAFAKEFCRLVEASIPTVLLVGNHDQHAQGAGGASLCIYRTLGVPGFIVGDTLTTHQIETQSGPIQIVTLPWLTRSTLLTRPETQGLSTEEIAELLLEKLRVVLEGEIRKLDRAVPTVLLAHVMTDTARYGAEKFLAVGKGFTVPMAILARDCFDYIALGHVHKYQQVNQCPLAIYPGSIERVDFSEEKEEKGYVIVEIGQGKTTAEFQALPARTFKTIEVDLTTSENPQSRLIEAIEQSAIAQAVVRVIYQVSASQIETIDNTLLGDALATAHSYTIQPQLVSQTSRPRLPELGTDNTLLPMSALQAYLDNRQDLAAIAPDILQAAQALLSQDPNGDKTIGKTVEAATDSQELLAIAEDSHQLRLL